MKRIVCAAEHGQVRVHSTAPDQKDRCRKYSRRLSLSFTVHMSSTLLPSHQDRWRIGITPNETQIVIFFLRSFGMVVVGIFISSRLTLSFRRCGKMNSKYNNNTYLSSFITAILVFNLPHYLRQTFIVFIVKRGASGMSVEDFNGSQTHTQHIVILSNGLNMNEPPNICLALSRKPYEKLSINGAHRFRPNAGKYLSYQKGKVHLFVSLLIE